MRKGCIGSTGGSSTDDSLFGVVAALFAADDVSLGEAQIDGPNGENFGCGGWFSDSTFNEPDLSLDEADGTSKEVLVFWVVAPAMTLGEPIGDGLSGDSNASEPSDVDELLTKDVCCVGIFSPGDNLDGSVPARDLPAVVGVVFAGAAAGVTDGKGTLLPGDPARSCCQIDLFGTRSSCIFLPSLATFSIYFLVDIPLLLGLLRIHSRVKRRASSSDRVV